MKQFCYIYLLPLIGTLVAATPVENAEKRLRNGDAVGALSELKGCESVESSFWKGRALIELGRMKEAADYLAKVPETHELYAYAAKALLYCAWQSPDVEFASIVPTLAAGQHPEVSKLAAAALAEYWLQQPENHENTALALLRDLAGKSPDIQPVLQLLEVENLRQKGQYQEAIKLCKRMEDNRDLSAEMRQRARLALAEIFYAQEAAGLLHSPQSNDERTDIADTQEMEETEVTITEGKGEETLLHFISTNPESPLLTEAFRRLAVHKAFSKGKYARARLKEWIEDVEKPRRASISLLILQHLINQDNPEGIPPDNACANTALSQFPREEATQLILLEHTRYLLEHGNNTEAAKYLEHVSLTSPYKTFFTAYILAEQNPQQAAELFRDCARSAPEDLRTAAFANCLLCALRSGNEPLKQEILQYPRFTPEAKAEVYAALFLYYKGKDATLAREALQQLQQIPYSAKDFMVDFLLDKAWFSMDDSPLMVEQELAHTNTRCFLPGQLLRYYMIREVSMRAASPSDRRAETEDRICELIRQAIHDTKNNHLNHRLRFHLAHLLSKRSQHAESYQQLMELNKISGNGHMASQSLFHAAHEKELIGTEESLTEATEIYSLCAEKFSELRVPASIQQASVLIRIGKGEEAENLLKHLISKENGLTPELRVLIWMTLSNKHVLEGTPEGLEKALQAANQCLQETELPKLWRCSALLHRAAICSRSAAYQTAHDDYMEVLRLRPAHKDSSTDKEWAIFHQAGIGAVASLLELKKFREAADLADSISDWKSDSGRTRKLKRYAEWATYIRQTNFLRSR